MSSIVRPPDPCLVAIILIVRSRAGPRFVFHYPPNPLSENGLRPASKSRRASRSKSTQGNKSNDSSSSDESNSTTDDEEEENQSHLAGSGMSTTRRMSNFGVEDRHHHSHPLSASPMTSTSVGAGGAGGGEASQSQSQRPGSLGSGRALFRKRGPNSDVEDDTGAGAERQEDPSPTSGPFIPPWETLLGLPSDVWEKLLSPSRSWHKRRFEVGINDLAFVGWPVFVREDGTWQKQRRKKKSKRRSEAYAREGESHDESADDRAGCEEGIEAMADSTDTLISPRAIGSPELKRTSRTSSKAPMTSCSVDGDDKDSMTMFNVVFVLDPPLLEYSIRLREVYDNIIKKFAKALKWEQARTDYVWKEAQNISHFKEKAKEKRSSVTGLYTELISHSPLARAIYTLYTSISASKIASLSLSPDVSISLQIPPLTSSHYLPGPTDKAYPGLWLTTADSVTPVDDDPTADENTAPHQVLAKHFALLLLDNEASIIKDVEASASALAPALVHYIRCSKSTQSFAHISTASGIPLSTIQMLASHLVYWRRARAIPPLHQRDTYIVSPNCDLSKLDIATAAFHQAFPTCPSLPKMLSALSGTPRPYGSFIPSKDHKDTYFNILAWLLRGGWVTQLRSFGRIKVSPEIKMAVERAIRKKQMDKFLAETGPNSVSEVIPTENERNEHVDDDSSSSSSSSLGSQGSGDETPMPGRYHDPMANEMYLSHSLMDHNMPLRTASLILSPHRASPLESRWLEELVSQFPDNGELSVAASHGSRDYAGSQISLQKLWPLLIKYFNGYDAFEKIPIREGLKRKPTWQVLTRLGLGTGQSHVELDPREQVLVTVRHW
ncbi:nitrogen permease regulator 3 family protein [Aspergillus glaucus CBS 516.65]|uniref:Nitrogen permease regulator 3 n=1 Tax=Aspergillus glaucus CBS 516.65 TaxID=1160497 RepID=A0A1L9VHN9_ASPGL|nr:hypothetical protein ASPGLDRAFT_36177 [Aspergillus glaucus CBS 516.65]OJJ83410.1 hypothetical protein ASPGLDRAFT_36177 [Aspergillus glaucus CBS 516.65]